MGFRVPPAANFIAGGVPEIRFHQCQGGTDQCRWELVISKEGTRRIRWGNRLDQVLAGAIIQARRLAQQAALHIKKRG